MAAVSDCDIVEKLLPPEANEVLLMMQFEFRSIQFQIPPTFEVFRSSTV